MRDTTHHAALREWARGTYPEEAAVELLLRAFDGRFAMTSDPWILPDDYGGWCVDWERLQDSAVLTGPFSGGERRVLGICASLGSSLNKLALTDVLAGLGEKNIRLVLAAMSHASGVHERGSGVLFPWPEEGE
jgi:hypothetical protein